MKLYFVAGEASGDNHGGELLHALIARDSRLQFFGRGGPKMRAIAAGGFRDWIDEAAMVGLWEVLKCYRFFRREFHRVIDEITELRPDAAVLIDYPGFNLRLAKALRKKNPSLKIIYYISPQVWAWNQRRVDAMARSIDLMLCIFPFERQFYEGAGLRALFVGHPMASVIPSEVACRAVVERRPEASSEDTVKVQPRDPSTPLRSAQDDKEETAAQDDGVENGGGRDPQLVALFPGSRRREVAKILPVMFAAAIQLSRSHPQLYFEIAAASDSLVDEIRHAIRNKAAKFSIGVGQARELMMRAQAAMVASGTATLEAALSRLPFVLVYRVSWLTYFAARVVVKVKWLGMPNVLANREIVPEFIQHRAQPMEIARAVSRLLDDSKVRATMLADFKAVSAKLTTGEAAANAADAILEELKAPARVLRREAAASIEARK